MWKTLPKEPFSKLIIPQFFCFGCVIVSFIALDPSYPAHAAHWMPHITRQSRSFTAGLSPFPIVESRHHRPGVRSSPRYTPEETAVRKELSGIVIRCLTAMGSRMPPQFAARSSPALYPHGGRTDSAGCGWPVTAGTLRVWPHMPLPAPGPSRSYVPRAVKNISLAPQKKFRGNSC